MAKPMNTEKWGKKTASERYTQHLQDDGPTRAPGGKQVNIGLIDQPKLDETGPEMQKPQAVNDWHGHAYDNDAKGWVRGMAKDPYPHFDKGPSGLRHKGK